MRRRNFVIVGIVAVVLAIGVVVGMHWHQTQSQKNERAARLHAVSLGPQVMVKEVLPGGGVRRLTLPGEARPFLSTTVYAKLPGYLREVRIDSGQRVKEGEVLAVLESPETAQDVLAARTNLELQRLLATRLEGLAKIGVVSQQDREVAEAQLQTSRSTLQRTRDVQRYQVIKAPFSGLVTARYADPGALIPAATGSTQAAQPIVDLADTSVLRITVYVGQDVASAIHLGDKAVIWTDDQPTRKLQGRISIVAGQLEPRTRTMLTEIWFDNTEAGILVGTFVRVELDVAEPPFPTMPNAALIVRAGHLLAALVEGTRVHLVPVAIGWSDGNRTQVTNGLDAGQFVAVDFPAELDDGATIQPVRPDAGTASPGGATPARLSP